MRRSTLLSFIPALLLLWCVPAVAQQKTSPAPLKATEIKATPRGSGAEMYANYCATCHGMKGKGDGPAAPALKSGITDLSQLTKKNAGKFPADHVTSVLRFGSEITAHGSSTMPTWGPLLRSLNTSEEAEAQLRIANIVKHIESLQTK